MSNNEYRDAVNEGIREGAWTLRKLLPWGILGIIILVVIGWGLHSSEIIDKNIDREITQHSRQYTESKQAILQNLYSQYASLQTGIVEAEANSLTDVAEAKQAQQKALVLQMKREATNIPHDQIPAEIKILIQ
ncbi:MAG: hypothetical protein WCJ51_03355 [Candidatus Moraniibacteriota bacterium]